MVFHNPFFPFQSLFKLNKISLKFIFTPALREAKFYLSSSWELFSKKNRIPLSNFFSSSNMFLANTLDCPKNWGSPWSIKRKGEFDSLFTITAEIRHARSLAKFYGQYADRRMNLKFVGRVSERERKIRQSFIVKNKLMSVFNASVLLLIMNFVITLSNASWIHS